MHSRLLWSAAILVLTGSISAKDVYLSISGTVGVFRTDARVFNPSSTKDIQIQASFLPAGNASNASVQSLSITIPKRQMMIYDDVVGSLFAINGTLGAIRLSSADDFIATSRIYAQSSAGCIGTLGQFVPGLDASIAAKTKGVLLQLKSNGAAGQTGTFRTNIGAVNPNASAATVTWRLYDKANALYSTGTPTTMPPFAVIAPTSMASGFFFNAAGADLSDAWVSFTSDQPLLAYGSVLDNGTTDPTFIPMSEDTGVATVPAVKTYDVLLRSFAIQISPAVSVGAGDVVTMRITARDTAHGFQLVGPAGELLVPGNLYNPGDPVVTKTFTIPSEGTYNYFCTRPACGAGHGSMAGSFDAGKKTNDPRY